jgi:hypothetical protein
MRTPPCPLAAGLFGAVLAVLPCSAQPASTPTPTRAEREALATLVRTVESNAPALDIADADWPLHRLRASDGSHYVAFSIIAPGAIPLDRPLTLYVRLATAREGLPAAAPERSALAEWLAGQTPGPAPPRGGIAFGEMPTYGAGSIATRGPTPQSQGLQLLELERERAREKREAQDRARKAALEGTDPARGPRPLLPFEDFDLRAPAASAGGTPVIRRSVTAPPGDYELTVAWLDPEVQPLASSVRLARRRLTLPPAPLSTLALSTVIVADEVRVRETPVHATEQTRHPYSIGPTEITPARDSALTTDERLAFVVQIINARGTPAGKPDVAVGFRVLRKNGIAEDVVGTLAPQLFNETTLPADFDIAKGHPIFAAVAVPLQTFKRGEYRLEVAADDRVAGSGTLTNAGFTVIATPSALLRDAPPLVLPFRREDLLQPPVINEITARLRPRAPSAAMLAALATARERRFVDLVRDGSVGPEEAGARSALRALALYALGDTTASLTPPLQVAQQQAAPAAGTEIIVGALRALEGNDREALVAWTAAQAAGASASIVAPLMMNAWLRLGEPERAVTLGRASVTAGTHDAVVARRLAAALITTNRPGEAVEIFDQHLRQNPADLEAQWLALHALFRGFVTGTNPGTDAAGRARIVELASAYAAANGQHALLAREWAQAVAGAPASAPQP